MAKNSIPIRDARQLGALIRLTRRAQELRQDEIGRFSHSFIGEIEAGKPTAQIGKVLEALRELGIKVFVELPPDVSPEDAAAASQ